MTDRTPRCVPGGRRRCDPPVRPQDGSRRLTSPGRTPRARAAWGAVALGFLITACGQARPPAVSGGPPAAASAGAGTTGTPAAVGAVSAPSATASSTTVTAVDTTLRDYTVSATPLTVPAGTVRLDVTNADPVPHNVVLVSTDLPADRLPTVGIRVDEASGAVAVVTRTATLAPGAKGSLIASLVRGRYLLVCTVPHHYVRDGMYAVLQVE